MKNALLLIGCVILCNLAGILGALSTDTGASPWYQQLNKPAFNPPGWIFGPVWTLLYTMMGVALYLLIRQWPVSRVAIALFALQLLLNALWTPVFFGMQQMGWAIVVIVMMWLAIAATMLAAWRTSPAAVWLLAPYLAWVTFATILNVTLWRMNS
jgi:tryptophan-rich sensory protein